MNKYCIFLDKAEAILGRFVVGKSLGIPGYSRGGYGQFRQPNQRCTVYDYMR